MIEPGQPVPEAHVFDGEGSAPLPVFFDGATLLVFFRDECSRCEAMLGLAGEVGRRARGLTVIGVSQETIEDTGGLLHRIGVRMPVVIDDRPYPASAAFGFTLMPSAVLIENDIVGWISDGCSTDDLRRLPLKNWTDLEPVLSSDAEPSLSRERR